MQHLLAAAGVERRHFFERGERDLVRGRVAEPDVVELHGYRPCGHRAGAGLLLDQRHQVEDLEYPLEADERTHDLHARIGQAGQRRVQAGQQEGQRDHLARLQLARERQAATQAVHECQRKGRDEHERGEEDPLQHGRPYADVADACRANPELDGFLVRTPEQLDQRGPGRREPLRHLGAHGGVVVRGLAAECCEPAAHAAGRDEEDRQHDDGEDRHQHRRAEHHDQREDQRHEVGDHPRQRSAEGLLGADHVVVEPADEGSGTGAGEEGDRHFLDMVEDGGAEVQDHALADPRRIPPGDHRHRGVENGNQGDDGGEAHHRRRLAVGDDDVHHLTGQHRSRYGEEGPRHGEHHEDRQLRTVGHGEGDDPLQRFLREFVPAVIGGGDPVQGAPGRAFHAHAHSSSSSFPQLRPESTGFPPSCPGTISGCAGVHLGRPRGLTPANT